MDLCHTCREVGHCCSNNSFSRHHESTKNSMNPKGMLSLGQVKGFLNPSLGSVNLDLESGKGISWSMPGNSCKIVWRSGGPLLPERSSQHSLGLESQQPWLTELQATTKSFCLLSHVDPGLAEIAAADFLRSSQATAFLVWSSFFTTASSSPFSQPFQRALSFQSYSGAHADMFRISEAATVIAVASNLDSVCQALPVPTKTLWADSGKQWAWPGMAVTEGIEMQQVGQDITCNSDDKL